ncbi:MAG TPA: translation elongation factor Ts [Fibrobacteraceae bacterium]|nr:translation elongation factor Ts [Fibrobacteraceae bacterium]
MTITASMVNALREKTGVGMMQCKKALTETQGDEEKAIELLRKHGASVATKRADKDAKEGLVVLNAANGKAVIAEINCETDFVAKSDDFKALAQDVVNALMANEIPSVDALLTAKVGALDINGRISEVMAKIGEKISVRRIANFSYGANEVVFTYSHLGGKAGSVVKLAYTGTPSDVAELNALAKDVAMQAVAFDAVAIDESGVPAEIIGKEREIAKDQILNEGKTKPEFVDRQVEGRIKKFLQGICLESQAYLRDSKVSVKDHIKSVADKIGLSSLKISQFIKFELGK